MATASATVYVSGDKFLPYHIQVEQRSDWHHRFEITLSVEKAKVLGDVKNAHDSIAIANAFAYVGEEVEIIIERVSGNFEFKGYITDVHIDQTYAGDAFVIFSGFSPTYFLDGQISVDSFEEMALQDIVNKVLSTYPGNLSKKIDPAFSSTIPYITRYKESQYQFLSRLASIYNEWFFYDGQQLVFGNLPDGPSEVLTFGSDSMLSFNYGLNLKASTFKQQFYKYQENDVLSNSVKSFKPGWLDKHAKTALNVSDKLFTEEGLDPVSLDVTDKSHIRKLSEAKKSSILSDNVVFTGQSANPGLKVGGKVDVNARSGFIGSYRIIAVTHSFDSNRDYFNHFRAIPVTNTAPPANTWVQMPAAEPQVGVVIDNEDPESLGRVRVQLKWQPAGQQTPWIRVITNYAGGDHGTYFIPEIDDEVLVEFEQGNPDRPYVIGSLYHGNTPPEWFDAKNRYKGFKTKGKNQIKADDKNKSITISAPHSINMSAGKLINIKTGGKDDSEVNINVGEGTVNIVAKVVKVEAAETIKMEAEKEIVAYSNEVIDMNATQDVLVSANQNIAMSGTQNVDIQATEINIDGTAATNMQSAQVEISGSATTKVSGGMVDVEGTGPVNVKGMPIKLN